MRLLLFRISKYLVSERNASMMHFARFIVLLTHMENNNTQPEGDSGLGHIANTLIQEGLPSVEEMRAVVEENERRVLFQEIESTLKEYEDLFNKFKKGEQTDQERDRMGALLVKIEAFQKSLGIK
jgi:hypothetical protein